MSRRRAGFLAGALALALALAACASEPVPQKEGLPAEASAAAEPAPAPAPEASQPAAPAEQGAVDEARAKAIALEHAGLHEDEVTFTKVHLDVEHGRNEWEIEFVSGTTEHDFDIDAATGQITSYDNEFDRDAAAIQGAEGDVIGEEAAKAAALSHAGIALSECTELKAELDVERNVMTYDVEFKAGGMEHSYSIDALTGEILYFEVEVDD